MFSLNVVDLHSPFCFFSTTLSAFAKLEETVCIRDLVPESNSSRNFAGTTSQKSTSLTLSLFSSHLTLPTTTKLYNDLNPRTIPVHGSLYRFSSSHPSGGSPLRRYPLSLTSRASARLFGGTRCPQLSFTKTSEQPYRLFSKDYFTFKGECVRRRRPSHARMVSISLPSLLETL